MRLFGRKTVLAEREPLGEFKVFERKEITQRVEPGFSPDENLNMGFQNKS